MHTHLPNKNSLNKCCLPETRGAAAFWNRKGVLMMTLMQRGTIVMLEVYFEAIKEL
jgi:hypothetical protein